jgi:hypothetical protein
VEVGVARMGVSVGRGVEVVVGVRVWYQRGVGLGVRVGGIRAVGVTSASGGYSSSMAVRQSRPLVKTNSLSLEAGKE